MSSAFVSEIFPTVQGEGPLTGEKQIFLRLAGCPLRCDYCDTPDSLVAEGHKKMTGQDVLEAVQKIQKEQSINTVSVTGGEPLAQVGFLKDILPLFKKNNLKVYLETAGIHPDALKQVVDYCDVVSMDIKLPSATKKEFWNEHEAFLKIGGSKIFVKIVIENHTKQDEMEKAISILASLDEPPLLILQPVTPQPPNISAVNPILVENLHQKALVKLPVVKIMPQQHKIWKIR